MTKNLVAVVVLLSVALWTGCATGGGGHSKGVTVTVSSGGVSVLAVTLTTQFTATVVGSDNHAVTWSVSGDGCSGATCGTINSSGLYTAPAAAPDPTKVKIIATSQADTTRSGFVQIDVIQVLTIVTPKINDTELSVARNTTQQFTATALPDDKRAQSFTWSVTQNNVDCSPACGTIDQNGLYTAPNTSPLSLNVTATSTIDPTGHDTVNVTLTAARFSAGTYAFHLTGFDANGAVAIAGNFATTSSGTITGGTQDELTTTQHVTRTITGGSLSLDNNGHGTLTLNTSTGAPRTYKVGFNANGDGKMIEFDLVARASGRIVLATTRVKNEGLLEPNSTFVFGLQGIDTVLNRTGLVGSFNPDGFGGIDSGMLDINDHGTISLQDAIDPLSSGYVIQSDGRGLLSLTDNATGKTYNYAIYVGNGITNKAVNPLTLFAISIDDPQANPAVSGEIVFQDPTPSYVNADFTDFFVANLTGVNDTGHSRVSLTIGAGNGSGQLSGLYDANNAGTIVPAKVFAGYSYNANPINTGRYEIDLLSDPTTQFVLYSSASSRGFLLQIDQTNNSSFVYTGTMNPQPGGFFARSQMAGSYVAATVNPGTANVDHTLGNFLFTSLLPDFTIGGKQDEADGGLNQTIAGTYSLERDGTGKINLTQPATQKYVFYALDNPKIDTRKDSTMNLHFVMINVDTGNADPAVIFAER